MKIISCFKAVPDAEAIATTPSGDLSFEKAKLVISDYDINAIEEGAKLAASCEGSFAALSVGLAGITDTKLKKDVLSRGPEELFLVADDALAGADAHQTAAVLAAALGKIGEYDLVLMGEGSADVYSQQVGIQLGEALGVPVVNGAVKVEVSDGKAVVERSLEHVVERVSVSLPAVICVAPEINVPRIPGMRELLSAGKKPSTAWAVADLGIEVPEATLELESVKAPAKVERKNIKFADDSDETIAKFIEAIRAEFK